jgi:hydroxyquinol 1,2-dioxygenase
MTEPIDRAPGRTEPADITAAVIGSFRGSSDPRRRYLLQRIVAHIHAFAAEVGLTNAEWTHAIATLSESGAITDEHRNEFVLWSDALGLSMLVDALEHPLPTGATESTVLGPFYAPGAPLREYGASLTQEPAGVPAWVHGRVTDLDGAPIADAELDVWQNGADRLYAVQRQDTAEDHLRGRLRTLSDGRFAFLGVAPVPYQIPHDGPVGRMLESNGRHAWRPAHIHMIVRATGYHTLVTHIFDRASEYLDSDAVFAVKPGLLRDFRPRSATDPERPLGVDGDWVSVETDIVLAGD